MELRNYQVEAIEKARNSIRSGHKRIIIQANTGAGKTIIAGAIISSALEKGKKVIFLVHFRQLAYQAMERFQDFGISDEIGIIMANEDPHLDRPVQIVSVQTYGRRLKLDDLKHNQWFKNADIVFYDEAHSSIAKTRKAILNLYKDNAIIIGLTATPARADGRPLSEIYDDIVCCSNIKELTSLGHLVPAIYYGATELPDLNNIPTVAGDYNQKVLGKRVNKEKLVGDILENWLRIASDRQTVVFATNVKHSKYIQTVFSRHGISIEHIDAHTPEEDRKYILKRFKAGDVQVVTNVGVFCEGADFPWASCVVLAKPSKSFTRFIQMAGRGIRPYPNKDNCILIDHAGLVQRHGFLDEDVSWSLDGKEKAWNKKKPQKKNKPPLTCDQCQYIFKGKVCPKCGYEVKNYGKKIEVLEAELQEITRGGKVKKTFTMDDKRKFYGQLEYEKRMRGYKDGWVYYKYLAKFKTKPHHSLRDTPPIQPDASFFNWLTYQNIKRAKSLQNPRNRMAV
ncbi:MAG: DEAD/DEAH box helicase [Elusimicrobiota bacterium]|nr:DEAD/DEAH box helicase [Elusimicrobiota bacterium]